MTNAEQKLWRAIRHRQLGAKFRRQAPVAPFIVDFLCHDRKMIIEIDGGQHADQWKADARRTAFLNEKGYTVLRFWNNEVLNNLEGVLTVIASHLDHPHPSPLPPAGEGERGASAAGGNLQSPPPQGEG